MLAIINQLPPNLVEVICLPAACDNHPEKILPGIKAKVKTARKAGFTPIVIYGDCGIGGQLDAFLDEQNIARVLGPHCYHSFMGEADFDSAIDQELGTFFLTGYMVRHFERIVMRGMGLRERPHLRETYFAHHKRVLYIAQTDDATLVEKASQASAILQLGCDYHYTGGGDCMAFLHNLCSRRQPSVATSSTYLYRGSFKSRRICHMAHLITLLWRDIPAQVIAESGRGRNRQQAKIELPRRFAIAIDAAAMKDGAASTDDYLAEWRRSEPVSCSEDLDEEAAKLATDIEADYPAERVRKLVESGGFDRD